MECHMHLYTGVIAHDLPSLRRLAPLNTSLPSSPRRPPCRIAFLAASDPSSCARACLSQPLCEAATWFPPTFAAPALDVRRLRAACVGRTAGTPATWRRTGEPYTSFSPSSSSSSPSSSSTTTTSSSSLPNTTVSALRWCGSGCGLQASLDALCASRNASGAWCGAAVARNTRGWRGVEDFAWACVASPPRDAPLEMACVDDRGHLALCRVTPQTLREGSGVTGRRDCCPSPFAPPSPFGSPRCPTATKSRAACREECVAISAALHDAHRAACAPRAACLHGPGLTPAPTSPPLPSASSSSPASTSSFFSSSFPLPFSPSSPSSPSPSPSLPPLPRWRPLRVEEARRRLEGLRRLGYLNCTAQHEDTASKCTARLGTAEWLRWYWAAWGTPSSRERRGGAHAEVSWWRPPSPSEPMVGGQGGEEQRYRQAADLFDLEAFLGAMQSLASKRVITASFGESKRKHAAWFISLVGDSTIRQQAVSLCCLLTAASRATASAAHSYRVDIDRSVPHAKLRCNVLQRQPSGDALLGVVTYRRTYRMDSLSPARPSEINPRLPLALQVALAAKPHVLLTGPGGWEFEEGCDDRHTLHDALCNEQRGNTWLQRRPWVLSEFATRWALVLEAINANVPPADRASTLVLMRTPTPRDFEPVDVMQGGSCSRLQPMAESEVQEGRAVDVTSMRFAELSKAAILAALVVERAPWVRMLDAYAIARLRADSHVGRLLSPASKCGFSGLPPPCYDCVHFCLPGIPDVLNGRLLFLLQHQSTDGSSAATSVLARWNPWWHGVEPLVQRANHTPFGRPSTAAAGALAVQLRHDRGVPPVRLKCTPADFFDDDARGQLGVCAPTSDPGR